VLDLYRKCGIEFSSFMRFFIPFRAPGRPPGVLVLRGHDHHRHSSPVLHEQGIIGVLTLLLFPMNMGHPAYRNNACSSTGDNSFSIGTLNAISKRRFKRGEIFGGGFRSI
jgi:hypothetical protein